MLRPKTILRKASRAAGFATMARLTGGTATIEIDIDNRQEPVTVNIDGGDELMIRHAGRAAELLLCGEPHEMPDELHGRAYAMLDAQGMAALEEQAEEIRRQLTLAYKERDEAEAAEAEEHTQPSQMET